MLRHGMERALRSEQAERSRERLLDAAAEEFWLHGLSGSRIQDMLDRAEMTKGGLYHHFTTKQELAEALMLSEDETRGRLQEAGIEPLDEEAPAELAAEA